MFTDIKDFTAKSSNMTRTELNVFLKNHEELLIPIVHHFNGRIIKTIGDSLLVTFRSSYNALLCGIFMQDGVKKHNVHALEKEKFNIRIGLNTGPVEFRKNDVFGTTVNIASRIESISEEDSVYLSETVHADLGNSNGFSFEDLGKKELKGIEEEIRLYRYNLNYDKIDFINLINSVKIDYEGYLKKKPALKPVNNNYKQPNFFSRNFYQIFILLVFLGIVISGYLYFNRETDFRILKNININLSKNNIENASILVKKINFEYPYSKYTIEANRAFFEKKFNILINTREYKRAEDLISQAENDYAWFAGRNYKKTLNKELLKMNMKINNKDEIERLSNILYQNYPNDDDIITLLKTVNGFEFKKIKENIKIDENKIPEKHTDYSDKIETISNIQKKEDKTLNRITEFDFSNDNELRKKQFIKLRNHGMSNKLIVLYHFKNLLYFTPSNANDMQETINFFKKLSSNNDWENLRTQNIFNIKSIYVFNFYSEISNNTLDVLISAFPEKSVEMALENMFSSNISQRYYCYRIITEIKDDIKMTNSTKKQFHTSNLTHEENISDLRPYNFLLEKGVEFFKNNLNDENKEILKKSIKIIQNKIDFYTYDTKEFFKSQYLPELIVIRDSIKNLLK
ncbi:MAG: adenylate/guanylate cyclase domain-containing protein [Candidatus Muirbacterium halophilum]|nr:adenylate/guanylate cyclase domain-containing protein [Candidatus Muirbacterium halophilum]